MDIRAATLDEWPRLRDLRLRALADTPDAFGETLAEAEEGGLEHWRRWIEGWPISTDHAVLVAEDAGDWCGMAVADVSRHVPDRADLYGMWVDPARRGEGIGRLLIAAVIEWARARALRAVHLGVTETNQAATALYRRSGFTPTGESEPLREGSTLACIRLERVL